MLEKRTYLHSAATVMNAVNDLIEMHKGVVTLSDTQNGRVNYIVCFDGCRHELKVAVVDVGYNRSNVSIEASGLDPDGKKLLRHEFSLLGAMLDAESGINMEKS